MRTKKGVALGIFDTLTLGIPMFIRYMMKEPKKTLKVSSIVLPPVVLFTWLLLYFS